MGKLDGQVALITGGTKGIGEAAVRLFVQEGARVVLCGRARQDGERIAAELNGGGTQRAAFLRWMWRIMKTGSRRFLL